MKKPWFSKQSWQPHPAYENFCPTQSHRLGFDEFKVIKIVEPVYAIIGLPAESVDFVRGLVIGKTIHTFTQSSKERAWVEVG